MSQEMGRLLIVIGIVLVVVGLLVTFGKGIPFLGRLPGDIRIEKDNFRFYFPLASSILVSLVVTLLIRLFRR
jgi:uncharacterized membrane protein